MNISIFSDRLLYYKKGKKGQYNLPELGQYGVLDLVNGQDITLDKHIKNADHRESILYISQNQTKIIYYSKFVNYQRNKKEGIIQINSLENGQLFGYIVCDDHMIQNQTSLTNRWCLSSAHNKQRKTVLVEPNPLKNITAISYNEKHNEIYTGNRCGDILIWA